MRIAYVEDNPTNQALVERVARMTEHVIVPYAEGEIALHALQTEPFDLIMMDIELAGKVNGLDVVRSLRSAGLKTPIIAVTAYAMLGDRDRCLEAGCNNYLPKPIPIKDLLDLLGRYDAALKAPAAPLAETPAAPVPITPPAEPEPVPAPAPIVVPVTPPVVAEAVTATPEAQAEAESKKAITAAISEAPPAPALVAAPASPVTPAAIPVTPPVVPDRLAGAGPAPESATAPASGSWPETPTPVIVTPLPQTEASAPPTGDSASVAEGSEPAATPA